jgi:oligopeptidase B
VSSSKTTSEVRLLDTEGDDGTFWVFAERQGGVEYGVEHAVLGGEDVLLVLHNRTGPDFEIGVAPVAPTPAERWHPLVAHDPAVRLEDVDAFAGHLVVHQRSEGLTQLRLLTLDEHGVADDYLVEFDQEIYTVGSSGNPDFDAPVVRLGYTSMTVPASIYDYDVAARELTLLRRTPVLGGYDPADYEEHRLWATADDGEQVPLSFVCRRGATAGGPIPVLLYGYGAYETSMDPYFAIARLSVLDRGAGFAIAHVRGGGEMGRRWYDSGKLLHKRTTFTDFVSCAEHLVDTGVTTPAGLAVRGGSAGGLLMGGVANMAPQDYRVIIAQVPFVDVVTTMLDDSIPLTTNEYDEWGNPEDKAFYEYMLSYSPYDNLKKQDYPAMFVGTGLWDSQVQYYEPTKWVARLRTVKTDANPLVYRINMEAGHGGKSGRFQRYRETAEYYGFMLEQLGIRE